MNTLLMLAAGGYIIFAIARVFDRPGLFAPVYLLSHGLAVFFGPIGVFAGAVSIISSIAATNADKRQQVIIPCEYAFLVWVGMLVLSIFTSPQIEITVEYIGALLLLATGTYLYARTFAAYPRFFGDLFWGGIFITTICTARMALGVDVFARFGASFNLSPVGLSLLPELCFLGILSYVLFHRGHSRLVTAGLLLFACIVLVPLVTALGTRSMVLSVGAVFLVLLLLRTWHGDVARLLVGMTAVLGALTASAVFFWSSLATSKLGMLIALGGAHMVSGAATGEVQGDPSAMERFQLYDQAWQIYQRHPIFGSGAGAFGYLADGANGAYPHNLFLEILVESGAFGLLLFLAFSAPLLLSGIRDTLKKPASWTAIFALSLFIGAFIQLQVSMPVTDGKFLFLALGCFAARILAEQHSVRPQGFTNSAPTELPLA